MRGGQFILSEFILSEAELQGKESLAIALGVFRPNISEGSIQSGDSLLHPKQVGAFLI